jgi:hypothetical protein
VAKQPTSARAIAARQTLRRWITTPKIADIARLVHCADLVTDRVTKEHKLALRCRVGLDSGRRLA